MLNNLNMPNGSGFYAIKKIQEIDPKAKIIAVTADTSTVTEEKLEKLNDPCSKTVQNGTIISIQH